VVPSSGFLKKKTFASSSVIRTNTYSNNDDRHRRPHTNYGSSLYAASSEGFDRRKFILDGTIAISSMVALTEHSQEAYADGSVRSSSALEDIPITHKVFFDVRISRPDGTFYIKDEEDSTNPDDLVFRGRLTFGLFGIVAPQCVQNFLKYVSVIIDPLDENPMPSYGRSTIPSLDEGTGLITFGNLPGLDISNLNGATGIRYRQRILSAPLWIESRDKQDDNNKINHIEKGLLTHRNLDLSPQFYITTYADSRELDGTHTVFGRVLSDEQGESLEFFDRCSRLPRYSLDRPKTLQNKVSNDQSITEKVAADIFQKQKNFFRGAARAAGDTRIDSIYEGKYLRRVDVTQVGQL